MDALNKVSRYLGINAQFLRVQEWAKVYWVCVRGQRPTLLSKKTVDRAAELEVRYTIAGEAIVTDSRTGKGYILRKPGYGSGSWAIKEIAAGQTVGLYSAFPEVRGTIHRAFAAEKPQTLRELMIRMSVTCFDIQVAA